MNNMKRLSDIVDRFSKLKILVVGDIILDEFMWGSVSRISPEAPVPVVDVEKENIMLGGAANVLTNINALGGNAVICGVIGNDYNGERFMSIIKESGFSTEGIFIDPERLTSIKIRVVAQHQQVVRFDKETRDRLSKKTYYNMIDFLDSRLHEFDAVIISDYGKGLLSRGIISKTLQYKKKSGLIVTVDPKIRNFRFYKGVTVITPNQKEAEDACGFEINNQKSLIRAGLLLLKRYQTEAILITRGEHGMSLFQKNGKIEHIPTAAKEVYDVTGAGDTVISALSLALATNASWLDACIISNKAAGIVVGKIGTASASVNELKKAIIEI